MGMRPEAHKNGRTGIDPPLIISANLL